MDDCIEWGGTRSYGYGRYRLGGKSWLAHRLAWVRMNGPIPDSACVLHRCDNPPCFNVNHLFLGDRADNNQDRASKGRSVRAHLGKVGEETPHHKITSNDAAEIRSAWRFGATTKKIADVFAIAESTIRQIIHGKTWVSR